MMFDVTPLMLLFKNAPKRRTHSNHSWVILWPVVTSKQHASTGNSTSTTKPYSGVKSIIAGLLDTIMVVLGLVHVVNVPFQREFHFYFLCCFYLLFNSNHVAFFRWNARSLSTENWKRARLLRREEPNLRLLGVPEWSYTNIAVTDYSMYCSYCNGFYKRKLVFILHAVSVFQ